MTAGRHLTAAEMDGFTRRLRTYAACYPDSDFLDNSLSYAESGRPFTRENAAKVDDALHSWETRLNAPSFDPDRTPPGLDLLTWKLAVTWRTQMDERGLRCPSRRIIYAELARVISRDRLRENHAPWRDVPDGTAPGWYRMMSHVITWYIEHETDEDTAWYAHERLAQPGEVTRIAGYLRDQAKLGAFSGRAGPANARTPSAGRKAQVRDFIQRRKDIRDRP